MPFYSLSQDEIRIYCKNAIESLEHWLRRLVDETFTKAHGSNYIDAKDENGQNLINNSIKKEINDRISIEPTRYARPIDAVVLETLIKVVCRPELYNNYFKNALEKAFPLGSEDARKRLELLIPPRNCLSHANAISVRQAEQVVCYSNDVIDSIKEYYVEENKAELYNAPTIIKVTDSLGNTVHSTQISRNNTGRGFCDFSINERTYLYPNDKITIEVEVDPSFPNPDYKVTWVYHEMSDEHKILESKKLELNIEDKHVCEDFVVYCQVTSDKNWHRCRDCDDSVAIKYKVLPPR